MKDYKGIDELSDTIVGFRKRNNGIKRDIDIG